MALLGRNNKRRALIALAIVTIACLGLVFTQGTVNWDTAATNLFVLGITVGLSATIALCVGGRGQKE